MGFNYILIDGPIKYLPNDVGINYEGVCGISSIIPLIIMLIVYMLIKDKKAKRAMIIVSFLIAVITFFILSQMVWDYLYYDFALKFFFNLLFIQLLILPITIILIHKISKSEKKGIITVETISIFIALILLFYLLNTFIIKVDPDHIDYNYQVSITTKNETSGYVLVPFIEEEDHSSKILRSLSKSGNVHDIEITKTVKGNGLNISFSSFTELKGNGKIDSYIDVDMYEWENFEYIWVFVSMEQPDTVNIEFKWDIGGGGSDEDWHFSGEIFGNGWHKINGETSESTD